MQKFFSLVFLLFFVLQHLDAQSITYHELTESSFNFYNMGYTIREINDVVYDKETDQILLGGCAADEPSDYTPLVPWIAYTKFRRIEEERNLSGKLFKSHYIKKDEVFGFSVKKFIKLSNKVYGLNGGVLTFIKPDKWSDFGKSTYYPYGDKDFTYGFFDFRPNKIIAGYWIDRIGKFGLQMVNDELGFNDAEGKKMGSWNWPNQKNISFHMCPQADESGFHYAISTFANFDDSKVKVYLQKFKIQESGISENPHISSTPIALPLKQVYREEYGDSTTTYLFDALYDRFDPNHSIVRFNDKGNLVIVMHSSGTVKKERKSVIYIEVTKEGKLVKADTLCTFKRDAFTSLKLKYDDNGNYMIIYQRKGMMTGEDLIVDIKMFDANSFELKKRVNLSMSKWYFSRLCNDEATLKNSNLTAHVGNILVTHLLGSANYYLVMHVNGFYDKQKSRLLIAKLYCLP
jgi:hypothetical protein